MQLALPAKSREYACIMNKGAILLILLVVLGGVGLFAYSKLQQQSEANRPTFVAVSEPPAGASIMDELMTPEYAARDASVVGMWIPHPQGWQGTATKVTLESDGVAVRIWMPVATLASTGVWVICYFEGIESLSAFPITDGQAIRYAGKAHQVDVIAEGPIPTPRLVVRPAYLVK
jgi:hypothetical protein